MGRLRHLEIGGVRLRAEARVGDEIVGAHRLAASRYMAMIRGRRCRQRMTMGVRIAPPGRADIVRCGAGVRHSMGAVCVRVRCDLPARAWALQACNVVAGRVIGGGDG